MYSVFHFTVAEVSGDSDFHKPFNHNKHVLFVQLQTHTPIYISFNFAVCAYGTRMSERSSHLALPLATVSDNTLSCFLVVAHKISVIFSVCHFGSLNIWFQSFQYLYLLSRWSIERYISTLSDPHVTMTSRIVLFAVSYQSQTLASGRVFIP